MNKENIIAQLYTVRNFCRNLDDFSRSIEKIAKIGYTGVQVSGVGPLDAKDIRRVCDDFQLKILATHRPFEEFLGAKFEKMVEMHNILGCPYPGIGSMPGELYPRTKEGYIAFGQTLATICDKMPDNMKLIYHNHAFEFCRFDGKTGHELILENGGEKLMAEIDTFWVTSGGSEPSEYIRRYANRVDFLHFKDYGVNEKGERKMRPVGEGNENWAGIIKACDESGVKYVAVEQDDCNGLDPFDCMKTSYDNLCRMFAQYK